jgi:hypothetical protein
MATEKEVLCSADKEQIFILAVTERFVQVVVIESALVTVMPSVDLSIAFSL